MLYIPKGFDHRILTLEDKTEVLYKAKDYYNPQDESGIIWNDKELNIDWKFKEYGIDEKNLILSEKDKKQLSFEKFLEENK